MIRRLGHTGGPATRPWPDALQTLLLEAALSEGDAARRAFERWYALVDIEQLDYPAHRILPLLYRRLSALNIQCADLERLKGVYRHYWYTNQMLFNDARSALQALDQHGIETLVLKGLALSVAYYRDSGARPMSDVDVLVRRADAAHALDVLRRLGYTRALDVPLERVLRTRHALQLHSPSGRELDLHWYALHWPYDDRDLWSASLPLTLNHTRTRMLCPADQLLHVCVHAVNAFYPAPMRWLADAVTVIERSGERLDWQRLAERARARRCTLALLDALAHLSRHAKIPAAVIARLRDAPVSAAERIAHKATLRTYPHGSALLLEWDWYRRLRTLGVQATPRSFAAFLEDSWNVDGYGPLAALISRRLAAALAQELRRRAAFAPHAGFAHGSGSGR